MFVFVFVYLLLFRITRSVGMCFVFIIALSVVLCLLWLVFCWEGKRKSLHLVSAHHILRSRLGFVRSTCCA